MERLAVAGGAPYDPIEGAIHMARYALALPFVQGRHVLDVACGEGYGAWALLQAGAARIEAVDFSDEAIGKAKITFKNANLKFQVADAETIDGIFPQLTFDVVISCETIEHLHDPVRFLRAIRKIAKADAVIVITCPNDHWYYSEHDGNPYHQRKFTFEEFKALTQAELGASVSWHLGSASFGFATLPHGCSDQNITGPASRLPTVSGSVVVPAEIRVPGAEREPTPETCSYFVGVWNAPLERVGGGAHHTISMDVYRDLMANFAMHREMKQLKRVEAELRIVGVQAAALRKESEILARSVADLKSQRDRLQNDRDILAQNAAELMRQSRSLADELEVAGAEKSGLNRSIQELQRAFKWGEERINSLDEALVWHVQRVQTLEGERDTAQEELQRNRTFSDARVQVLESERDAALARVGCWKNIKRSMIELTPRPLQSLARSFYDKFVRRCRTGLSG